MDEAGAIFSNPLSIAVYFYTAVAAVTALGILVNWVESAPSRRRERWLRHTALRPVARPLSLR